MSISPTAPDPCWLFLMMRNTAAEAAVTTAMVVIAMLSQCLSVSDRFSVCCIEVSLLADSQQVHEYGEPGEPEDCHHHVDGPMPKVAIAEGEVGSQDGPQAGR